MGLNVKVSGRKQNYRILYFLQLITSIFKNPGMNKFNELIRKLNYTEIGEIVMDITLIATGFADIMIDPICRSGTQWR